MGLLNLAGIVDGGYLEECNNDCCPGISKFLRNSDCIAIKSSVIKIVYQSLLNHDACKRLLLQGRREGFAR